MCLMSSNPGGYPNEDVFLGVHTRRRKYHSTHTPLRITWTNSSFRTLDSGSPLVNGWMGFGSGFIEGLLDLLKILRSMSLVASLILWVMKAGFFTDQTGNMFPMYVNINTDIYHISQHDPTCMSMFFLLHASSGMLLSHAVARPTIIQCSVWTQNSYV